MKKIVVSLSSIVSKKGDIKAKIDDLGKVLNYYTNETADGLTNILQNKIDKDWADRDLKNHNVIPGGSIDE